MPDYVKDIKIGSTTYPIAAGKIVYGTTPSVATVTVKSLELTSVTSGVTSTATYNVVVAG